MTASEALIGHKRMDLFLVDEVSFVDYATVGFTTVRKHDFFFILIGTV